MVREADFEVRSLITDLLLKQMNILTAEIHLAI